MKTETEKAPSGLRVDHREGLTHFFSDALIAVLESFLQGRNRGFGGRSDVAQHPGRSAAVWIAPLFHDKQEPRHRGQADGSQYAGRFPPSFWAVGT